MRTGQPYILIGGQAVNYWAEHYLSTEPQLEQLQPFTSEDIDFKGGHADVQRIARQLELSSRLSAQGANDRTGRNHSLSNRRPEINH